MPSDLPQCQLSRLQRIQNAAVRLVSRVRLQPHVASDLILRDLHWLPVRTRITYKLLLYVYKSLHSPAPVYMPLVSLLQRKTRDSRFRQLYQLELSAPVASRAVARRTF